MAYSPSLMLDNVVYGCMPPYRYFKTFQIGVWGNKIYKIWRNRQEYFLFQSKCLRRLTIQMFWLRIRTSEFEEKRGAFYTANGASIKTTLTVKGVRQMSTLVNKGGSRACQRWQIGAIYPFKSNWDVSIGHFLEKGRTNFLFDKSFINVTEKP